MYFHLSCFVMIFKVKKITLTVINLSVGESPKLINNIVLFGIMIIQMIMIFTNNGPMESYLELQVLTLYS